MPSRRPLRRSNTLLDRFFPRTRLAAALLVVPAIAVAQTQAPQDLRSYAIEPGALAPALSRFALQANLALSFAPELAAGKTTQGLNGSFDVESGLRQLLAGTGLEAVSVGAGAYSLRQIASGAIRLQTMKIQASGYRPFETPPEQPGLKADFQGAATKMPLSIRETPQAITVITRDSIEARQAMDINSALELVAGFSAAGKAFAGNSPRTGEAFVLRGQTLDDTRDIRIEGFTAGGDINNFDLAPFERVEVVKGPSSMLYGQGSLGGFINLVRKKPQPDTAFRVVGQAGSWDTYRTEFDATGSLSADSSVLGQTSMAYEDSGSFIDGVNSERAVLAPSIEWQLGEHSRLFFDVLYQYDKFRPSLGIALINDGDSLREPDVSRSFFFGVPNTKDSKSSTLQATVRVEQDITDNWLATLVMHGSRNRLLGIADSYGYGLDTYGNTHLYSSYVNHDHPAWAGELRIDGRFEAFGLEHQLLAGVEKNGRNSKFTGSAGYPYIGTANIYDGSLDNAVFIPGHDNPRAVESTDRRSNAALYTQLLLSVAERTKILLGARYDHSESDYINNGESSTGDDNQKDSDTTFRVGVTQDFSANLTGYAVYAQSFNPVQAVSRDGLLEPETGEGYELGLKGDWFDNRLGATLAVYRQELDNTPIPEGPNSDYSVSAGLQRADGIEVEITGAPLPGWNIGAAASWLDAEYIDSDDPNDGLTPGGTIERSASLFTSYELQSGAWRGAGVGVTVVDVGDRIVISGEYYDEDGNWLAQNFEIDGYQRLDLQLFYNGIKDWNLSLQVRNVTDERYLERTGPYMYGHFFGSPRAYLARAEYTFN